MTGQLLVKNQKFKSLPEMFGVENNISIIAGPCSIESYEQMELVARELVKNNVRFIRGGAYKPRTSPYDFQGLGADGLKILNEIRNKYHLFAVSEIMDPRDIEIVESCTDIMQIGSRNMQNFSLLKEAGQSKHPVLLKRGMMSTVDEFLLAAEYIALNGNKNIILCERGIRTFENSTRYTLDFSCIAIVKQETSLPIIADLSHSLGRTDISLLLAKALKSMGTDGIMIEAHPSPDKALSDKNRQFNFTQLEKLISNLF
jgi:3-deoxy-7-phosphoheptulonate synthase